MIGRSALALVCLLPACLPSLLLLLLLLLLILLLLLLLLLLRLVVFCPFPSLACGPSPPLLHPDPGPDWQWKKSRGGEEEEEGGKEEEEGKEEGPGVAFFASGVPAS